MVSERVLNILQREGFDELQIAEIDRRYSEPHRKYHNWSHIEDLLDKLEIFAGHVHRRSVVELAIIFHDVIYDEGKPDSENVKASAALYEQMTRYETGSAPRHMVTQMIMSTDGHKPRPLFDGNHAIARRNSVLVHDYKNDVDLFLDLDLSILAAEPERFARYEREIREEYHMYADAGFAKGRAHVMGEFAKRDQLYRHKATRAAFDKKTRRNLAACVSFWEGEARRLVGTPNASINWPKASLG